MAGELVEVQPNHTEIPAAALVTPAAPGGKIRARSRKLTMTSINDIADLVQILQNNPGWRDTVRSLIVGEELGKLPEHMAIFVKTTNENFTLVHQQFEKVDQRLEGLEQDVSTLKGDVSTIKEDVGTIKEDLGALKGDVGTIKEDLGALNKTVGTMGGNVRRLIGSDYESHVSTYVHRFLSRERGIEATVFSDERNKSDLTKLLDRAEKDKTILKDETDEVDKADLILTLQDSEDYILAEISVTIGQKDIDRAAERAAFLAMATSRTVTPYVIGATEEEDLQKEHVQVLLIPEPQPPQTAE